MQKEVDVEGKMKIKQNSVDAPSSEHDEKKRHLSHGSPKKEAETAVLAFCDEKETSDVKKIAKPISEEIQIPDGFPPLKRVISKDTRRYHSNVSRAASDPVFVSHYHQPLSQQHLPEDLQFLTSLHEVEFVQKWEEHGAIEGLKTSHIIFNFHEYLCIYRPINHDFVHQELQRLCCIDVYPKRQSVHKEMLCGYLGGMIEIVRIHRNFSVIDDWQCEVYGDVSCLSWARPHITQRDQKNRFFLVTFRKYPGLIMLFDRFAKNDTIHEYVRKRGRTTKSSHRPAVISQSANPIQIWDVSPTLIKVMKWSPNKKFLAVGNESGSIIILNYKTREKIVEFQSWFGAITALAWSKDSLYLASGGQDDLVYCWDVNQRNCLAVGEGHMSWITDIDFEERPNLESPYRFVSTSRDTRIIFWTFSPLDFDVSPDRGPRIHDCLNVDDVPRIENKISNDVLQHPVSAVLRTKHFFLTCDATTLSVWRRKDDQIVEHCVKEVRESREVAMLQTQQNNRHRF